MATDESLKPGFKLTPAPVASNAHDTTPWRGFDSHAASPIFFSSAKNKHRPSSMPPALAHGILPRHGLPRPPPWQRAEVLERSPCWRLLQPAAAELLQLLSVFPGGGRLGPSWRPVRAPLQGHAVPSPFSSAGGLGPCNGRAPRRWVSGVVPLRLLDLRPLQLPRPPAVGTPTMTSSPATPARCRLLNTCAGTLLIDFDAAPSP
jgi:hypothetical protein